MASLKLSQVPSRIRAREIKPGDTVYHRNGKGPDYDLLPIDIVDVKEEKGMVHVYRKGGWAANFYPDELVIGIPR